MKRMLKKQSKLWHLQYFTQSLISLFRRLRQKGESVIEVETCKESTSPVVYISSMCCRKVIKYDFKRSVVSQCFIAVECILVVTTGDLVYTDSMAIRQKSIQEFIREQSRTFLLNHKEYFWKKGLGWVLRKLIEENEICPSNSRKRLNEILVCALKLLVRESLCAKLYVCRK